MLAFSKSDGVFVPVRFRDVVAGVHPVGFDDGVDLSLTVLLVFGVIVQIG